MLADFQDINPQSNFLGKDVHLPAASLYALIEFIADELPRWRDRSDRPAGTAETHLTSLLCAHLNSAARHSTGWDFLQFRIEEPDEQHKGRKIDLIPAPCDATVWIGGRRHTDFDTLLPIECKRLPTPKEKNRDIREYVVNRYASTGGIQRFKAGHHGSAHKLAAMIAYVQEGTLLYWKNRVANWIKRLAKGGQPGWTVDDVLYLERNDETRQIAVFYSSHARDKGLEQIELRHLWLKMN
jgi:hypothetical protein